MVRSRMLLRLVPFGFVAAIGLLSAFAVAGVWAVTQSATTLSVIYWLLPAVVVGALFTVYGTHLLQDATVRSKPEMDRGLLVKHGRMLGAVFVIFSITVSVASFVYVVDLRTTIRQQRLDQQAAIAGLKAEMVQKWLFERSMGTQMLATTIRNLAPDAREFTREEASLLELLFGEALAGQQDSLAIRLFSTDGRLIAAVGDPMDARDGAFRGTPDSAPRAAPGGKPRIEERRASAEKLLLDFVLPMVKGPGPGAVGAILVVTTDPAKTLLPEVKRWPSASASSEIVLVEQEGDKAVLVFSPAKGAGDSPGPTAIPLSQTTAIAVQAVRQGDGVREGLDDRNVLVLSASRRIDGTGWYLIAKTDVAEALAPFDRRIRLVIWATLGAIVLAGVTSAGLWHAYKTSYLGMLARHERERAALQRSVGGKP